MTFAPKSYEMEPSHWTRSVYHLEKLDSVVYFLGRERGLWSWLWHKISPWEAVLVLDESPCWHQPGMLLWMLHLELSASELYTAEGGILLSMILTGATASFKFTYKAMSDVETSPSHKCTHAHARTHIHTRTQAAMSMRLLPKIMIHKAVALLPGPCSAFHHFQCILQETKCGLRAGVHQLFIKLKGV